MTKLKCLLIATLLAISGCATQLQQNKTNATIDKFKDGNLAVVEANIEDAFKTKNALYYLEKGQVERLMGGAKIIQSTKDFLTADQFVQTWEVQTSERIKRTLSDIGSYLLAEGLSSDYDLKNYEISLLSQYLALNHLSQGNWNNAMVEAKKMAQREKTIEALIEKKVSVLAEKQKTEANGFQSMGATDKIESISGYPVNLLSDPESSQLKNSYQSAAAYYLSAFVYESQGETSLAAPGYRLAIELRPDVGFLKDSLSNLESNVRNIGIKNGADTLFIIDTGFTPRIDSYKLNKTFNVGYGPRVVTIAFPVIQNAPDIFKPSFVQIDSQNISPELITNIDSMARRNLQDEMPGYVFRATTRAITSLIAQGAVAEAAKKNSRNSRDNGNNYNALAGALGGLLAGIALQSINVADVRHWSTLPAQTYMSRLTLPAGLRTLKYATSTGKVHTQEIKLIEGYNVVYLRLFRDGASVITSNDAQSSADAANAITGSATDNESATISAGEGIVGKVKHFFYKVPN